MRKVPFLFSLCLMLTTLASCAAIEDIFRTSSTWIGVVAVGLTVIILIWFLGRLKK